MGVEVHSIEELGGKLVEHEHYIVFRLADDVPFTAASMEAASNTETVFGRLTIMYSEEYGGLAIEIMGAPTKENLLLALNIQLPLKVELQPSSTDLDILSIVMRRDEGPTLYVEPSQVVNGAMLAACIKRLRELSGLDIGFWWVNSYRGALELSIFDPDDEIEGEFAIEHAALVEHFKPRYAHYGFTFADCVYDENDKLSAVLHTVRILSDDYPEVPNLELLHELPGVIEVAYDPEGFPELYVVTAGSEIFTYQDPRRFVESLHALGVLIARTVGIDPIYNNHGAYRVYLGDRNTAPKIEQSFDILSDQPKG